MGTHVSQDDNSNVGAAAGACRMAAVRRPGLARQGAAAQACPLGACMKVRPAGIFVAAVRHTKSVVASWKALVSPQQGFPHFHTRRVEEGRCFFHKK
jgi:hypothetical protein